MYVTNPTPAKAAPGYLAPSTLRRLRKLAIGHVGSAFRDERELARFKKELNKVVS